MKLEVGMYARTILGISKLIEVRKNRYVFDKLDKNLWSDDIADEIWGYEIKDVIIKTSFNIIDLIEVGDYVNGKEVITIYKKDDNFIGNSNYIFKEKTVEVSNDNYETIPTDCLFKNDEIKSIVTKEHFEEIEYKVDE